MGLGGRVEGAGLGFRVRVRFQGSKYTFLGLRVRVRI